MQRLASREALLHPEPACRLTLSQLLAAICGDSQGDARNEALLGLLVAKASGPSLLRVQRSFSRVDSSRSSTSFNGGGGGDVGAAADAAPRQTPAAIRDAQHQGEEGTAARVEYARL